RRIGSKPSWRGRCRTRRSAAARISSSRPGTARMNRPRASPVSCAPSPPPPPRAASCSEAFLTVQGVASPVPNCHDDRELMRSRLLREIVFDTETTGLEPLKGDRLVEIGAVELYNHLPTGRD